MDLEQHLLDRHCDLSLYRVYLDAENDIVTFLLWNLSGQVVGYQHYRPFAPKNQKNDPKAGRYYTRPGVEGDEEGPREARKKLAFFGVEILDRPGPVYLVEGIFDAVRLHNKGLAALAVLMNDPKKLRPFFRALGRETIAICDNDKAGRKLAKCGNRSFVVEGSKDLGDMTETQLTEFLDEIDI